MTTNIYSPRRPGSNLAAQVFFGACLLASFVALSEQQYLSHQSHNHIPAPMPSIDTIRIARKYANYIHLQCPMTSVNSQMLNIHQVKWVNEVDYWDKPDSSVLLTHMNVVGFSKLSFQLHENICFLSCGYVINNCYHRIKLWKLVYVDACVTITVKPNPSFIHLRPVNDSTSSVSLTHPVNDWTTALELMQLKCENNFDLPLSKKYVWMYFHNSATTTNEIWHKYDLDNENIFQMFINAKDNKSAPLSNFMKNLFDDKCPALHFQCASYYDKYNTNDLVYLITESKNITIINHPVPTPAPVKQDNGALIGGIIGGVLGFLLLLALLSLLLYFCCKKRRQNKNRNIITQSTTYIYPMPLIQTDNCCNSITTTYLPTSSVTLMDKTSQFSNQITDVRTCNYEYEQANNVAATHSVMPEIYSSRRMISCQPRDCNDDNLSVRFAERNTLYNDDGREYVTDEEFFHQTRDYYVQNYQQQQNDINVHYV